MARFEQSDRIREIVHKEFVQPARNAGKARLSIRAGDVLKEAEKDPNFPRSRTPMICKVLEGKKLLVENGLEIESIDGPPSRQSRTIVVRYRVVGGVRKAHSQRIDSGGRSAHDEPITKEDSAAWAKRVTGKLAGLLKEEMVAYGGGTHV